MSERQVPSDVKFTYRKGNFYRVIHVDGALGGLGPSGRYIHMSLFSERRPIPKEQVFDLTGDGTVADEPKQIDSLTGIFREVEACAIMDVATAKTLQDWLGKVIAQHEEVILKSIDAATRKRNHE